ncbi:hypothetical protein [Pseudoponticoccus marisrubri]|uniref:hypothetical protein n=1 Tax=Pseudoponticoccus marisrubri TaxID=1685382 RepID=UPI0012FD5B23|nr:hypothetical protein [Pseudoponticoccus marisrubri]
MSDLSPPETLITVVRARRLRALSALDGKRRSRPARQRLFSRAESATAIAA